MSNEQLKATLRDLHRHLESAGSAVDDELKNLLKALDSDIHQVLRQEAPPHEDHVSREEHSLAERSQELAARFAAQHPQLEGVLRQLGIALEGMGI
jgi:hypothetical protein